MRGRRSLVLLILFVACASPEAQPTGPALPAPVAGERRGDRCFNGKFWTTCEVSPQAEHPGQVFATRTWHLAHLAGGSSDRPDLNGYAPVRVDVIETAGVCIYVTRVHMNQAALSTVAVPKTALPAGVGCQ